MYLKSDSTILDFGINLFEETPVQIANKNFDRTNIFNQTPAPPKLPIPPPHYQNDRHQRLILRAQKGFAPVGG